MLIEIVGWLGTGFVLLAYLLVTLKKIKSASIEFQLLNTFGAVGIIINSYVHFAIPSVALNIIWLLIALYGLVSNSKK